jgi:hypothetical protein
VQASLLPEWAKRLDLSEHEDVAEIPGGFRLLRRRGIAAPASAAERW